MTNVTSNMPNSADDSKKGSHLPKIDSSDSRSPMAGSTEPGLPGEKLSRGGLQWRTTALVAGLVLLLHAAFLLQTAARLWERDHYRFFPVILCAVGLLVWFRIDGFKWNHTPQLSLRVIILGIVSLGLFTAATVLHSSFLGSVTALCSLWTCIWFLGGVELADRLRGPVFMLVLLIPLPLGKDLSLVVSLQKFASAAASSLLDVVDVRHLTSGVAITTVDKNYMVNEACSGIHSLFSCVSLVISCRFFKN